MKNGKLKRLFEEHEKTYDALLTYLESMRPKGKPYLCNCKKSLIYSIVENCHHSGNEKITWNRAIYICGDCGGYAE